MREFRDFQLRGGAGRVCVRRDRVAAVSEGDKLPFKDYLSADLHISAGEVVSVSDSYDDVLAWWKAEPLDAQDSDVLDGSSFPTLGGEILTVSKDDVVAVGSVRGSPHEPNRRCQLHLRGGSTIIVKEPLDDVLQWRYGRRGSP